MRWHWRVGIGRGWVFGPGASGGADRVCYLPCGRVQPIEAGARHMGNGRGRQRGGSRRRWGASSFGRLGGRTGLAAQRCVDGRGDMSVALGLRRVVALGFGCDVVRASRSAADRGAHRGLAWGSDQ